MLGTLPDVPLTKLDWAIVGATRIPINTVYNKAMAAQRFRVATEKSIPRDDSPKTVAPIPSAAWKKSAEGPAEIDVMTAFAPGWPANAPPPAPPLALYQCPSPLP